ncbi:hypothetical protein EI94DRAFT_1702676 [Lactarius quietus]|nr:hypothetical protein EI94DRAFT_1702676 [Lactarius quietus]
MLSFKWKWKFYFSLEVYSQILSDIGKVLPLSGLWRFQKFPATSKFTGMLEGGKEKGEAQDEPNESMYSRTSNQNNSQTKAQTKNAQGQAQGTSKGARQGIVPKATPPHLPTPGPLHQASPSVSAHPGPGPDAHALALLANITCAAQELPSLVPEADEDNDIACVILAEGPEDPSETWEHLDHGLN